MPDTELVHQRPDAMELLGELSRKTNDPQAAIEIAKQIVDLQVRQEELRQSRDRFEWEREGRQSKIDFDIALNRCQLEIETVAPNRNRENGITWADYEQIDKAIRPIYTKAGFSLSFSEGECSIPGKIKIIATLSKGGVNREFSQNITPGTNSKMSAPDSDAAANSRAQRYLVLKIFNIAVGISADEDGGDSELNEGRKRLTDAMAKAKSEEELTALYRSAVKDALAAKDYNGIKLFDQIRDKRRGELAQ